MMKKPGKPSEELPSINSIPANVQSRIEVTINKILAIEQQNDMMKQKEAEKQLQNNKELAEQKLNRKGCSKLLKSSATKLSKQNNLTAAKGSIRPGGKGSPSLQKSISFDVPEYQQDIIVMRAAKLKELVQSAINKRRIFACSKNFYSLAEALVKRGWLRKALPGQVVDYSSVTSDEDYIIQRLQYVLPNLLWTKRYVDKKEYGPHTIVSMIQRERNHNFSLKYGLNNLFQDIHWHDLTDSSTLAYPRSYFLTKMTERMEFLDDFRLTYCTSFLYHLSQMQELKEIFSKNGSVTSECIKFAMKQVQIACHKKNHEDIDEDLELSDQGEVYQEYSKIFNRILQKKDTVRIIDGRSVELYLLEIRKLVKTALNFFPHMRIDGQRNAWILKPSSSNRGNGIKILDKENQIMDFLKKNANCSYVLQKYIECPLLIYNTKFDIRQYFIVTVDGKRLRLWMYRNCYLKFSGQEFSLNNYARCVHLTNHTVQKFYKNGVRNSELPAHNMWSLLEFQNYLFKTGNPFIWSNKVFPGMINAIKTIVNASMDHIKFRKNSFEFFGADFMISAQFDPILLEINASPDLAYSTVTTKDICSAVVEDMVKVIVDLPRNQQASTGDFECVWTTSIPANVLPIYDLSLVGQKLIGSPGKGKGVQLMAEYGGNGKVRGFYEDVPKTVVKKKGKYYNVKSKYKEIPNENNQLENSKLISSNDRDRRPKQLICNDVKIKLGDSEASIPSHRLTQMKKDTNPNRPTTPEYIIASLKDVLMEDFCQFVNTLGDLDTKNSPTHSIRAKHPVFSTVENQNTPREGDSLRRDMKESWSQNSLKPNLPSPNRVLRQKKSLVSCNRIVYSKRSSLESKGSASKLRQISKPQKNSTNTKRLHSISTAMSDNRIWNVRPDSPADPPDYKNCCMKTARSTQTQCYKTTQHGVWARGKSSRSNRRLSSGNSMKRMKSRNIHLEEERNSYIQRLVNPVMIEDSVKTKLRKALLEGSLHPFMKLGESIDTPTNRSKLHPHFKQSVRNIAIDSTLQKSDGKDAKLKIREKM